MQILIDNDVLRVSVISRDSPDAVLCFTGVGHAYGGIDVQSEEFYRISFGATAIFIMDKQRSWGNNIDFGELKKALHPYTEGKKLYALGNSMGGFLAILSSRFFDLIAVVALSPQYSVSKRIIPEETRWYQYVNEIKEWRFESLEGSLLPTTQYYVFAATDEADSRHISLIPDENNIHKILFTDPSFAHLVAEKLKAAGVIYDAIYACFTLKSKDEIRRAIEPAIPLEMSR